MNRSFFGDATADLETSKQPLHPPRSQYDDFGIYAWVTMSELFSNSRHRTPTWFSQPDGEVRHAVIVFLRQPSNFVDIGDLRVVDAGDLLL